jgi:hypothetical protein
MRRWAWSLHSGPPAKRKCKFRTSGRNIPRKAVERDPTRSRVRANSSRNCGAAAGACATRGYRGSFSSAYKACHQAGTAGRTFLWRRELPGARLSYAGGTCALPASEQSLRLDTGGGGPDRAGIHEIRGALASPARAPALEIGGCLSQLDAPFERLLDHATSPFIRPEMRKRRRQLFANRQYLLKCCLSVMAVRTRNAVCICFRLSGIHS